MIVQKILIATLTAGLCLCLSFLHGKNLLPRFSFFNTAQSDMGENDPKNTIQVALLLDTSGSMSGLIEQAKSQLWNILNELARTRKNGQDPTLEIALYEYGNPSKAKNTNQIIQLTGFTSDMDLVSQQLFALTTDGGDEYCGTVIQTSLDELEWKHQDDLKIIYIAGNEEFTQGPVSFAAACLKAREKGITINTIYCGDYQSGIRESWKAGADAGRGEYMYIDHNQQTVYIETPFDGEINNLNNKLNDTYIAYGKQGREKKENQLYQDTNAAGYSSANNADRAAFKSSKKYKADDWDLVDAYQKDKNILKNKADMPDDFQAISIEDMEAKIQAIIAEREAIQQQIQDLDKKRRAYKEEQNTESVVGGLQDSMLKSLRKQAKEKGYEIKE